MPAAPPPPAAAIQFAAPAAHPPQPPARRRFPLRRVLLATALLLALAAAAFVLLVIRPFGSNSGHAGSPQLHGPASAPFHMDYPRSWTQLTPAQLATLPGQPLAVIRRKDGRGTLVVTERPPVTQPLAQLPQGLKRTLSRRFSDFREVGAKVANLHGSAPALLYTFARTKTGTAQSLVIVPSGNHSFALNAVVPPRSPDAAREVGAMIASFQPTGVH